MTWFRASASRRLFRRAAARVSLLSLLLISLTADSTHNHPGPDAGTGTWIPLSPGVEISSAPPPAVPGHALPCPACLQQRLLCMDRFERVPEGRMVAVALVRVAAVPSPPRAPMIPRADPRAPPACS